eukprot:Skav214764  [mRNA]  locus=scaffold1230:158615:162745:+ [translate_table: standard]
MQGDFGHPGFDERLRLVGSVFEKAYDDSVARHNAYLHDSQPWPVRRNRKIKRCRVVGVEVTKTRQTPRRARHGEFEPPAETLWETNVQLVKQLRRLQGVHNRLKKYRDVSMTPHVLRQNEKEWFLIQQCKSFRPSFAAWCTRHDLCQCWYTAKPDADWLGDLVEAMKTHVTSCINHEANVRRKQFRHAIDLDLLHFGGSLSHAILRDAASLAPSVYKIPKVVDAHLVRNVGKSKPMIQLEEQVHAQSLMDPMVNQCPVTLTPIEGMDRMCHAEGLPKLDGPELCIRGHQYSCDPDRIAASFFEYWAPFWLRDNHDDLHSCEPWHEFLELLKRVPALDMPDLDRCLTCDEWIHAIKRTKPKTSRGICGFSQPELLRMHPKLLEVIVQLFNDAVTTGLPAWLMTSKVLLVPKFPGGVLIKDMRPITVFSLLYRTWSKAVAFRVLQAWGTRIPNNVVGALPGRSCSTLSLRNAIQSERYISLDMEAGGYSLDITKCFNGIGRKPAEILLTFGGMGKQHVSLWFHSLANMSRCANILGSYSTPHGASTGLPEGDPISALGMVMIGFIWSSLIDQLGLRSTVFADDWNWDGMGRSSHLAALRLTDLFLRSLRLESDPSQCWAWGSTTKARKLWESISEEITGDPMHISVITAEKALGVFQHFSRLTQHGCQSARLQKGLDRLERLKRLPVELDDAAKLVQSNVWAMSFFGTDIVYVGAKHLNSFRTALTSVFLSKTRTTSTWLACSLLSKFAVDPFFYVVYRTLLQWKRLMMVDHASHDIIRFVLLHASDDPVRAFGPASVLCCYLKLVGWSILADGTLCDHLGRCFSLCDTPAAQINAFLWDAWDCVLTEKVHQRKELQLWPMLDTKETRRIKLHDDKRYRAILANLRCLGTMWAEHREKWCDFEADDTLQCCPLCGAEDNRQHFPFECPGISSLRDSFQNEIMAAKEHFPHCCFLPVMYKHPKMDVLHLANFNRTLPEPLVLDADEPHDFCFYTDGSCIFPEQGGRLSAWSVIWDQSTCKDERVQQSRRFRATGQTPTTLTPIQVGLTTGPQTINRAEFTAMLQIVRSVSSATIYSDSQWALDAFRAIQLNPCWQYHYGSPNDDLLFQLVAIAQYRCLDNFKLVKLAAHQSVNDVQCDVMLYHVLGNDAADRTAKQGVQRHISPFHDLSWEVGTWYRQQESVLLGLQPFIAQAEALRLDAFDAKRDAAKSIDDGGLFSLSKALSWKPEAVTLVQPFQIPDRVLAAFMPGASLLQLIVTYLLSLQWPEVPTPNVGCSWYEITLNFLGVTGVQIPRIANRGSQILEYIDPTRDETASLLPLQVWDVVRIMESAASHIRRFMGIHLVPTHLAKSRWRLGFVGYKQGLAGFLVRPIFHRLEDH